MDVEAPIIHGVNMEIEHVGQAFLAVVEQPEQLREEQEPMAEEKD